ncbi:ATP-dependent DNA helicase [Agromyces archimandritae]|nr:ATP-dependent DNA helicase [Agromyces archimandritae]
MSEHVRLTAAEIAERLGLHPPTAEQAAVIEADPRGQAIVVAGAGSGKTETMSNRVVWLLAGGHVAVSEVLGLTFTRKAAGELAERVRLRVGELADAGIGAFADDPLESATIATYNSFASAIYREHAMLIGREPDASVLGEASAWQLARRVVVASADDRLVELDASVDRLTGAVLSLSRAIAENVVDPGELRAFAREFCEANAELPHGPRQRVDSKDLAKALGDVAALDPLIDLAVAYQDAKRVGGYVEFSDQIALALQICTEHPEVVEEYRGRYRAVLLDEYQDTSVVQTRLLATLFGGCSVMAVGDPDQSIYGWRGASAANLARFGRDFAGGTAAAFDLSTSWRNPHRVLEAANTLIAPLADGAAIAKLPLSASPFAGEGAVETVWRETIEDEAAAVAAWFDGRLAGERTGAVLCRTFADITVFTDALEARGIPYHVLGVAGLLEQPVIADLVAALRVLHDPSAGAELLRVLGGARWRIGPADLAELGTLARWLADRDIATRRLGDEVRAKLRASIAVDETPSIVDALDFLISAPDGHRALAGFSPVALARMRRAGAQLQALRRRAGFALADFVHLVVHELQLDIEVAANPARRLGRESLDAFDELVAGFASSAEHATLGAFLGWLLEAEQRDRLSPRGEEPEPGAVQLLSIHASKGLEWDVVAIPRMVDGELPGRLRSTKGWIAFGELPYAFKGDAEELPEFVWQGHETQKDFDAALAAFGVENAERHAEEERRLAYVAVTRARAELLLSGSWWSRQTKPRPPGTFLWELSEAGLIPPDTLPAAPAEPENPLDASSERLSWPLDPLGRRRDAVEHAARAVRGAAERPSGEGIGPRLAEHIELLLAERRAREAGEQALTAPTRIPASRFKDYVDDPDAVERALRRPMPERPFRATRVGTLFHSWVERRSNGGGELDALDAADALGGADALAAADGLVGAADEERMARLRDTFLASPWGHRAPTAVELELHLPLGANVFVCKLDAVYEAPAEAIARGIRYEVVDWKTGRSPADARDLELKQTQLALYRLAYANWAGIDPSEIDALFYYVEEDLVIRPERLYDEAELRSAWASVAARSGSEGSEAAGASASAPV